MCNSKVCVHSYDGKPLRPFRVNLDGTTVRQLKNKVSPNSESDLRLIHEGQPLDDDSAPLSRYSKKARFEIQVVKKVHGG